MDLYWPFFENLSEQVEELYRQMIGEHLEEKGLDQSEITDYLEALNDDNDGWGQHWHYTLLDFYELMPKQEEAINYLQESAEEHWGFYQDAIKYAE